VLIDGKSSIFRTRLVRLVSGFGHRRLGWCAGPALAREHARLQRPMLLDRPPDALVGTREGPGAIVNSSSTFRLWGGFRPGAQLGWVASPASRGAQPGGIGVGREDWVLLQSGRVRRRAVSADPGCGVVIAERASRIGDDFGQRGPWNASEAALPGGGALVIRLAVRRASSLPTSRSSPAATCGPPGAPRVPRGGGARRGHSLDRACSTARARA